MRAIDPEETQVISPQEAPKDVTVFDLPRVEDREENASATVAEIQKCGAALQAAKRKLSSTRRKRYPLVKRDLPPAAQAS